MRIIDAALPPPHAAPHPLSLLPTGACRVRFLPPDGGAAVVVAEQPAAGGALRGEWARRLLGAAGLGADAPWHDGAPMPAHTWHDAAGAWRDLTSWVGAPSCVVALIGYAAPAGAPPRPPPLSARLTAARGCGERAFPPLARSCMSAARRDVHPEQPAKRAAPTRMTQLRLTAWAHMYVAQPHRRHRVQAARCDAARCGGMAGPAMQRQDVALSRQTSTSTMQVPESHLGYAAMCEAVFRLGRSTDHFTRFTFFGRWSDWCDDRTVERYRRTRTSVKREQTLADLHHNRQDLELGELDVIARDLELGELDVIARDLELGELDVIARDLELGELDVIATDLELGDLDVIARDLELGELDVIARDLELGELDVIATDLELGELDVIARDLELGELDVIARVFERFDDDDNGTLDADEVTQCFDTMGLGADEDAQAVLADLYRGGDVLTVEEFVDLLPAEAATAIIRAQLEWEAGAALRTPDVAAELRRGSKALCAAVGILKGLEGRATPARATLWCEPALHASYGLSYRCPTDVAGSLGGSARPPQPPASPPPSAAYAAYTDACAAYAVYTAAGLHGDIPTRLSCVVLLEGERRGTAGRVWAKGGRDAGVGGGAVALYARHNVRGGLQLLAREEALRGRVSLREEVERLRLESCQLRVEGLPRRGAGMTSVGARQCRALEERDLYDDQRRRRELAGEEDPEGQGRFHIPPP
eukprot:gene49647-51513_t